MICWLAGPAIAEPSAQEDVSPVENVPVDEAQQTTTNVGDLVSALAGEAEWMRNKVGSETTVRLLVSGDMGPREIGRLIRLLEAQKSVLTDDDD